MSLCAGMKLGPYEIVAPIGAGGMEEVYKARDTRLDRIVAIKVSREQFSERFEREARAVAALNYLGVLLKPIRARHRLNRGSARKLSHCGATARAARHGSRLSIARSKWWKAASMLPASPLYMAS